MAKGFRNIWTASEDERGEICKVSDISIPKLEGSGSMSRQTMRIPSPMSYPSEKVDLYRARADLRRCVVL
jgi:hypothetical protein